MNDNAGAFVAFMIGILCGVIVGGIAVAIRGDTKFIPQAKAKAIHETRQEAVKAGVAKWTANENGEVEFQWITKENSN